MDSDISIEISYEPEEFLQYFKFLPGGVPVGEIPKRLRLQNIETYMETLNKSAQTWKGLIKSDKPTDRIITASMDRFSQNTFTFDSLIIDPADRVMALAAAFILDARLHNIQPDKLQFPLIASLVTIAPPYLHEEATGSDV